MEKKKRFFIGLVLPETLSEEVRCLQQDFAKHYESTSALRSPPHITLVPPFHWEPSLLLSVEDALQQTALQYAPFSCEIMGTDAFPPRVIFLAPVLNEALLGLQTSLANLMEQSFGIKRDLRPFHPHITLAFRDLSSAHFHQAWSKYKDLSFRALLNVSSFSLLEYEGARWEVRKNFDLRNSKGPAFS